MSRPVAAYTITSLILLALISRSDVTSCETDDQPVFADKKFISWRNAKPGEFPFAVSLQWTFGALRHFCGGSLARPDIVLTACHCMMIRSDFDNSIFLADPKDRVVVAGSVNNDRGDTRFSSRVTVKIARFQAHPKCRNFQSNATDVIHGGWDYDLGMALLVRNLTFDGINLGPFRLPSYDPEELKRDMLNKMVKNEKCIVVGWGKRRPREKRDNGTREFWPELTVTLKDFAACYNTLCGFHKLYCDIDHWARRQVCATTVGDLEVCQGDSGGPLLCGEQAFLYGVVGWGPNCGEDEGVPSVYATVYDGWDFIIAALGKREALERSSEPQLSSILTLTMFLLTTPFW